MVFIIMKKFKIHPMFLVVIILSIMMGLGSDLFTVILALIIHECGHLMFLNIFKFKDNDISFYPFGGVIDYELKNDFLYKEILISLGGVIFNLIFFYLFLKLKLFEMAHLNLFLLIINLIPVLPLDGGRVGLYLLSYVIPFKLSKIIICIFSVLVCVFLFIYYLVNYSGIYLLLLFAVVIKINVFTLITLKKEYNKFLLLKYLHPNKKFRKKLTKMWLSNPLENLYYQKSLIFNYDSFTISEDELLNKNFKK